MACFPSSPLLHACIYHMHMPPWISHLELNSRPGLCPFISLLGSSTIGSSASFHNCVPLPSCVTQGYFGWQCLLSSPVTAYLLIGHLCIAVQDAFLLPQSFADISLGQSSQFTFSLRCFWHPANSPTFRPHFKNCAPKNQGHHHISVKIPLNRPPPPRAASTICF